MILLSIAMQYFTCNCVPIITVFEEAFDQYLEAILRDSNDSVFFFFLTGWAEK